MGVSPRLDGWASNFWSFTRKHRRFSPEITMFFPLNKWMTSNHEEFCASIVSLHYVIKSIQITLRLHKCILYIWENYHISLTWIKAIWGWFPLSTMIPVRSQWGRYNLPRIIIWEPFEKLKGSWWNYRLCQHFIFPHESNFILQSAKGSLEAVRAILRQNCMKLYFSLPTIILYVSVMFGQNPHGHLAGGV